MLSLLGPACYPTSVDAQDSLLPSAQVVQGPSSPKKSTQQSFKHKVPSNCAQPNIWMIRLLTIDFY